MRLTSPAPTTSGHLTASDRCRDAGGPGTQGRSQPDPADRARTEPTSAASPACAVRRAADAGSVMAVRGPRTAVATTWRGDEALRTARTCYDQLAGRAWRRAGVERADGSRACGVTADGGEVTEQGHAFLRDFGAEPPPESAHSAAPASTGASVARTSPGASAPRWRPVAWPRLDPSGSAIRRAVTITPAGCDRPRRRRSACRLALNG